ncbi:MAG: hypothetical protein DLM69_06075 [Candidatus Chloroheliales bacterium]|nr:MAG: hypothetical protein DLM69_06075 [Chloroflexota bacterium]
MAEEKTNEQGASDAPFDPVAWAARHLDLLHEPDYEAGAALRELNLPELKTMYQMLLQGYYIEEWPVLVWEVLSSQIDAELRLDD